MPLWWRIGGFFIGLFSVFSLGQRAKAEMYCLHDVIDWSDVYDVCDYGESNAVTNGESKCGYLAFNDRDGEYRNTTNCIAPYEGISYIYPWWCGIKLYKAQAATVNEQVLGSGWKYDDSVEIAGAENANGVLYDVVVHGVRDLRVSQSSTYTGCGYSADSKYGTRTIVLNDYGFVYTSMARIIGCMSGYTNLTGASVGEEISVDKINTVSCSRISSGGGAVPASCPGHDGDDNRLDLFSVTGLDGSVVCYFKTFDADTEEESLYDATGRFIYRDPGCYCYDTGRMACS